ncbi:MAG: cytochrome c oxidase subunit II transmembrane domain-containing protein [Comamonas sp.]
MSLMTAALPFLSRARPLLAAGGLALAAGAAWAQDTAPAPAAGGGLRLGLLWLCAILFAAVFVAMLAAIWHHRRAVKRRGESMQEPAWLELCWTLVPILIVLGAAWPVFKLLT